MIRYVDKFDAFLINANRHFIVTCQKKFIVQTTQCFFFLNEWYNPNAQYFPSPSICVGYVTPSICLCRRKSLIQPNENPYSISARFVNSWQSYGIKSNYQRNIEIYSTFFITVSCVLLPYSRWARYEFEWTQHFTRGEKSVCTGCGIAGVCSLTFCAHQTSISWIGLSNRSSN